MIPVTMSRRLVLFVYLVIQLFAVATMESYLVLRYEQLDISFNSSIFKSFYKCLCNRVMKNCVATSDTLTRPADQVNVITVDRDYTPNYVGTPRRECVIQEHRDKDTHLTVNCTVSRTQCHQAISLFPHNEEHDDVCGSTEVEIVWENDVNFTSYNDTFIPVRNCRDESTMESIQNSKVFGMQHLTLTNQADQEKKLTQAGNISVMVGASVGSVIMVTLVIAVIITVMRRKNMLRLSNVKEKPIEHGLDNGGHYQTVEFNTPSTAGANQDSGIELVKLASDMDDRGYSIVDISTSYPDSSTQISNTCGGLHKFHSIYYYDTSKLHSSEVETSKIIFCDQVQAEPFVDICITKPLGIPASNNPISTHSQDIPNDITCKETSENKMKEVHEESETLDFDSSSFPISSANSENLASNESDTLSHCYFTLINPVFGNQLSKGKTHISLHFEHKEFDGGKYPPVTPESPRGAVFCLNENDSHYSKLWRQPRHKKNSYDTILPCPHVIGVSHVVPQSPNQPMHRTH